MLLLEERGSEVGREGEGFEFWKKGGVWEASLQVRVATPQGF